MTTVRIIERPAFTVIGKQTWIDGPDNESFGRFWQQCQADGLLHNLHEIQRRVGQVCGAQTEGAVLGVSRVEADPANRAFYYMIAAEVPAEQAAAHPDLAAYQVPASRWAVFECRGPLPDALVAAEMYAFGEWLPGSPYRHALAPEMEVYPPTDEPTCQFWLPIEAK